MELTDFLKQFADDPIGFINQKSVICFVGSDDYPVLLFNRLMASLKKNSTLLFSYINGDELSSAQLQLQTLLWGQKALFRIGSISTTDSAAVRDFYAYLDGYQGPNSVLFFMSSTAYKECNTQRQWLVITVPDQISPRLLSLLSVLYPDCSAATMHLFGQRLLSRYPDSSVENALHLLNYATVMTAKNIDQFFDQVAPLLITDIGSLFALSQDLLAQQQKSFFQKWLAIESHYQPVFWISFFSNQLWRAHCFVTLMQNNQPQEAQKVATRTLPFSFMRVDWRKYKSSTKLRDAHHKLIEIDRKFKTVGGNYSFDLFFAEFFLVY